MMKSMLAASAAVLLLGILACLPAAAQTSPQATPQRAAPQSLPQGSYASSCRDARMLNGALVAFCDEGNGTWHTTTLAEAAQCNGGIQNLNGSLICGAGPQVGSSTAPENYNSASGTTGGQPTQTPAKPSTGTPTPAQRSY